MGTDEEEEVDNVSEAGSEAAGSEAGSEAAGSEVGSEAAGSEGPRSEAGSEAARSEAAGSEAAGSGVAGSGAPGSVGAASELSEDEDEEGLVDQDLGSFLCYSICIVVMEYYELSQADNLTIQRIRFECRLTRFQRV